MDSSVYSSLCIGFVTHDFIFRYEHEARTFQGRIRASLMQYLEQTIEHKYVAVFYPSVERVESRPAQNSQPSRIFSRRACSLELEYRKDSVKFEDLNIQNFAIEGWALVRKIEDNLDVFNYYRLLNSLGCFTFQNQRTISDEKKLNNIQIETNAGTKNFFLNFRNIENKVKNLKIWSPQEKQCFIRCVSLKIWSQNIFKVNNFVVCENRFKLKNSKLNFTSCTILNWNIKNG